MQSLARRCSIEQVTPTQSGGLHAAAVSTKDGGKPDDATGTLGARSGKARSDRPALEPSREKPGNWGDYGNGGSFKVRNASSSHPTVRVIVLPDPKVHECAAVLVSDANDRQQKFDP